VEELDDIDEVRTEVCDIDMPGSSTGSGELVEEGESFAEASPPEEKGRRPLREGSEGVESLGFWNQFRKFLTGAGWSSMTVPKEEIRPERGRKKVTAVPGLGG